MVQETHANFGEVPKKTNFQNQRKGTQIFLLRDGELQSVYDDYSLYPGATANYWKVMVYHNQTGFFYDRICRNNGKFWTRNQALFEIRRFGNRAEHLIFHVIPVGFQWEWLQYIWPEDATNGGKSVIATRDEQMAEATKRMEFLRHRKRKHPVDLFKEYKNDDYVLPLLEAAEEKSGGKYYPYYLIGNSALLLVSNDKREWQEERDRLNQDYAENHGGVPAFCFSWGKPESGEFQYILYRVVKSSLHS